MLKLRYSTTSPYVRKVSATIMECGLENHIQRIPTNPWAADTDLGTDNPLGKVPALTLGDGTVLFDSPVICEYLDSLGSAPRLFPPSGVERWTALRQQAMGDGILDAAVGRLLEGRRSTEQRSEVFISRYMAAIDRALNVLEDESAQLAERWSIGQLTVACALGYLDFRFATDDWRDNRQRLAAWYESFKDRPSLRETVPHE